MLILASDCVELNAHVSKVNSDSWPSDANILRTADLVTEHSLVQPVSISELLARRYFKISSLNERSSNAVVRSTIFNRTFNFVLISCIHKFCSDRK